MSHHRNSQKRFYVPGASYFITGVTKNRLPYFEEEIFCEIFAENLKICQKFKDFDLHAWFLGYDHFHLLMTPTGKNNISEIMRSLKTNTSCDINRIMNPNFEGEVTTPRLQEIYGRRPHFFDLKKKFIQKYPNSTQNPFPIFRWQQSFHDHVIRNGEDFLNHMNYIAGNPLKHNMPEDWRWVFVDDDIDLG